MTHRARYLDEDQTRLLSYFDGASATEVAERLDCSLPGLGEQLVVIRRILGVESTAEAVKAARAHGLI